MDKGYRAGFGLGGLVIGGLAGVIIGLLYAPRPGYETRAMVSDKVNEYWGEGQEIYARGVDKISDTYDIASEKVANVASQVKPRVAETSDELRDKIDEARDRIASQISKNAATAHDVISEKVPAAAIKIDEFADAAKEIVDQAADRIKSKDVEPESVLEHGVPVDFDLTVSTAPIAEALEETEAAAPAVAPDTYTAR